MWPFCSKPKTRLSSETKRAAIEGAVMANEQAALRLFNALGVTPEERKRHAISIERLLMSPLKIHGSKAER